MTAVATKENHGFNSRCLPVGYPSINQIFEWMTSGLPVWRDCQHPANVGSPSLRSQRPVPHYPTPVFAKTARTGSVPSTRVLYAYAIRKSAHIQYPASHDISVSNARTNPKHTSGKNLPTAWVLKHPTRKSFPYPYSNSPSPQLSQLRSDLCTLSHRSNLNFLPQLSPTQMGKLPALPPSVPHF